MEDAGCANSERAVLNFLTLVAKFFQESDCFDLDDLCGQLEKYHLYPKCPELKMNEDSAILGSKELKAFLFSDKNFLPSLEVSIKALLDLLLHQIQSQDQRDYKNIVPNLATPISSSLEIFEMHVSSKPIRTSVLNFLAALIRMLGRVDTPVADKGPMYLLILRIVGNFKKIGFARKSLLREILKQLKTLSVFMMQFSKGNDLYATPCYEKLMLVLSLLKEVLQCDLLRSEISPPKLTKNEETTVTNTKDILCKIMNTLPRHIQLLAQECLNLIV